MPDKDMSAEAVSSQPISLPDRTDFNNKIDSIIGPNGSSQKPIDLKTPDRKVRVQNASRSNAHHPLGITIDLNHPIPDGQFIRSPKKQ